MSIEGDTKSECFCFTLVYKYHICASDDQNEPIEDVHLDEVNDDKSSRTAHKCNFVYLRKFKTKGTIKIQNILQTF